MTEDPMPDSGRSVPADSIDGSFVPRARPEVRSTELDGELILTVPRCDDPTVLDSHLLDSTARIVWMTLDGVATIDELARDVASVVHEDAETIAVDLVALFRVLGRGGVLEGVVA